MNYLHYAEEQLNAWRAIVRFLKHHDMASLDAEEVVPLLVEADLEELRILVEQTADLERKPIRVLRKQASSMNVKYYAWKDKPQLIKAIRDKERERAISTKARDDQEISKSDGAS